VWRSFSSNNNRKYLTDCNFASLMSPHFLYLSLSSSTYDDDYSKQIK
jgi:hypothetical protein